MQSPSTRRSGVIVSANLKAQVRLWDGFIGEHGVIIEEITF